MSHLPHKILWIDDETVGRRFSITRKTAKGHKGSHGRDVERRKGRIINCHLVHNWRAIIILIPKFSVVTVLKKS